MAVRGEEDPAQSPPRTRKRLGPSARIGVGLVLGIAFGLFFGELVASMRKVGEVYIGLLQMTVMPYIVVALISKIPRLASSGGGAIAQRATVVMLALWAVGLLTLFFVPLALPEWTLTFVVALAALGFPLALVLAWAFEKTPEGMRRTGQALAFRSP